VIDSSRRKSASSREIATAAFGAVGAVGADGGAV
jgi:hypothetical protein